MEPLNARERTMALLKFLGLFLVVAVVLVWAIFFDVNMPTKQLTIQKAVIASLSKSNQDQKAIVNTMDSVYFQLSRYATSPTKEILANQIGKNVSKLYEIANADSGTTMGQMIFVAAQSFSNDLADKKQISSLDKATNDLAAKDNEIKELKEQATKDQMMIMALKNSSK